MPQLENGYTKIANELLEAIAAIRIPGEAMQVLLVIIRKTYGYCKKKDAISLSQFVAATGIKKPNVCRAVKKLLDMNIIKPLSKKIIKIIEKDNAYISEYELNKDCSSWIPLSKKITLSKKIKNVIEKDNLPLSKKIPTKETITKETITKERKKDFSAEFECFWGKYPKKQDKKKTKIKLDSILSKGNVSFDVIMNGLENYINSKSVANGYAMLATRWLNEERWEDEPDPIAKQVLKKHITDQQEREERIRLETLQFLGYKA